MKIKRITTAVGAFAITATQAGEIGHFAPGVLNIRDFAMPEPGFYGVLYSYGYTTDRLNDSQGDALRSITIRTGGTVDVNVDVDMYALAPTFIWVSPWKVFGAKYGAYISPTFANTSIGASLATQTGAGRNPETSNFGVGDLFVQPLWLSWAQKHWDFTLGYGLYAPIGEYDTENFTLPGGRSIAVEAADNIGYGFWTHQFQGAVAWYPWEDKRLAVTTALTYELHDEKEDFDLTPGQNLTFNWGASQFLPLRKDQKLLLEVGPAGYSSWQITDDSGSAAADPAVRDQVHAVGGQIGLAYLPWNAALNFHYFYEFASEDRFQGQSIGLNFAIKF